MDLNNLKPALAEEGVTMQVLHPETEEPIEGMTITLLGQDSSTYKKLKRVRQNAVLARVSKGKKAAQLDAEKLEQESVDDLVQLTTDWTGFELDGATLDLTPGNVRTVYEGWDWLREQAQEFVANRANFFRRAD